MTAPSSLVSNHQPLLNLKSSAREGDKAEGLTSQLLMTRVMHRLVHQLLAYQLGAHGFVPFSGSRTRALFYCLVLHCEAELEIL